MVAFKSRELLKNDFYDDVYVKKLDKCLIIFAKKKYLYFNSKEGMNPEDYVVTIYGNFVNTKLSVAVFTVLSTLMLHIPIKHCLEKCMRKVKDDDFRWINNDNESY